MSVVGAIEVQVVARTGGVGGQIERELHPVAARAGDRFGTVMGRGIGAVLRPFARRAGDDFGAEMTRSGRHHGISFGKLFGAGVASNLVAGGLQAGFRALGGAVRSGFGELSDYQAGLAQLDAGLRSTGGVVGRTSAYMEDLAGSIQKYSGQTDDSIVKSEQLLLTFNKVRDVAGKNSDIFTQATKASADLAARFGGDASSKAILLGKALQDPIRGVLALQRVGISFDASQRKSIETFAAHNDIVGAQRVILGEVQKEVGGSAAAFGKTLPGQVAIAKRTFEDFAQSVATKSLPAVTGGMRLLNRGLDSLGRAAGPVFAEVGRGFREFQAGFSGKGGAGALAQYGALMRQEFGAVQRIFGGLREHGTAAFHAIASAVQRFAVPVLGGLRSAFSSIGRSLSEHREQLAGLGRVFALVGGAVLKVVAVVGGEGLGLAFRVAGAAIGKIIDVLVPVGTAFVGLAQGVLGFTSTVIGGIGSMVRFVLRGFDFLIGGAAKVAGALGFHGIEHNLEDARGAVDGFLTQVGQDLDSAKGALSAGSEALGAAIAGGVKKGLDLQAEGDPLLAEALKTLRGGPAGVGISGTELNAILERGKNTGQKVAETFQGGFGTGLAAGIDDGGKAAKAAESAAVKAAKALGAAMTRELRDQARTIGTELAGVKAQFAKISAFRSSVLQQTSQFSQLGSLLNDNTTATAGGLVAALRNKLTGLKAFGDALATLGRRGLDKGALAELAQGGPDQRSLAVALSRGTSAELQQFNAAQRAIRQQSQVVASQATDSAFGQGSFVKTQRQLGGIEAQLKLVNKQLHDMPKWQAQATAQAIKNDKVTTRSNRRTAVPG